MALSGTGDRVAAILLIFIIVVIGIVAIQSLDLSNDSSPTPNSDRTVDPADTASGTFTVTYDMNGGSGSIVDSKQYAYGDVVHPIMSPTPTKLLSFFEGWSKSKNATAASYDSESDSFKIYSNTTLYAVWKIGYKITYDLNGGTGNITDNTVYYPFDKAQPIMTPTPTKEGYVFAGWDSDKNSKYAAYDDVNDSILIYDNITLYAVWRATIGYSYTVSYLNSFNYTMYSTHTETPTSGYKYAVVTMTVKNITYTDDYSPSYSCFKVDVGTNILYSYDYSSTYRYDDYVLKQTSPSSVDLTMGGSFTYTALYEIPKTAMVVDLIPPTPSVLSTYVHVKM